MTPFDKAKNEAAERSINRDMYELHEADARVRKFSEGADWAYAYAKSEDRETIEELVKALEFYADRGRQVHISKVEQDPEVGEFIHIDDFESTLKEPWCGTFSGKFARKALAKFKAKVGEG